MIAIVVILCCLGFILADETAHKHEDFHCNKHVLMEHMKRLNLTNKLGGKFYHQLFQSLPEAKSQFAEHFDKLEDVENMKYYQQLGHSLLSLLKELPEHCDDDHALKQEIMKIKKKHDEKHVDAKMFKKSKPAILKFLTDNTQMTNEEKEAWDHLITHSLHLYSELEGHSEEHEQH
ncbi:unnamed protein product [Soboliphyme baturini]|uniref:GLOBIN domain-containing protein n=1 Tax=Soboliphyme baturini TaxID=241478 RepID=A0A183IBE5_9BILA|nr:unnamed protein product [Soboliphyme baturini]